MSDVFRAIGAMSGALISGAKCTSKKPERPVAISATHGEIADHHGRTDHRVTGGVQRLLVRDQGSRPFPLSRIPRLPGRLSSSLVCEGRRSPLDSKLRRAGDLRLLHEVLGTWLSDRCGRAKAPARARALWC